MVNENKTLYDKIPMEILGGFYYQINLNVKKGILLENMYHEIELITKAAEKRGISLEKLYRIGFKLTWKNRVESGHSDCLFN